ncbi:uncharacterized protein LOC121878025 [Homarus americanus]|uniref:Uncharacterized protein n=1 Tax=Homarus americanus TaxID=6706 RepID=A0A8J5MPM7_HOMAM|nr:uncharacterized protein LOC121878025 [Homarus americanus]XP_042239916.1 uncharacterized protein LOC121878025 [Homarus americanus]KAG7159035.1 hypothetical protein Hamer_G024204 [Homarus americanus]
MKSITCVSTLTLVAVVLACNLHSTWSSPINWDNVHLTEEQKLTVKQVDDLLNQFLKQLEKKTQNKNPLRPHHDNNKKVGPAQDGTVTPPADTVKTPEETVAVVTEEKEVVVKDDGGCGVKHPVEGHPKSGGYDVVPVESHPVDKIAYTEGGRYTAVGEVEDDVDDTIFFPGG